MLEAIRSRNRSKKTNSPLVPKKEGLPLLSEDVEIDSGRSALLSAIKNRKKGGVSKAMVGNEQDSTIILSSVKPFQDFSMPCEETSNPQGSSAIEPLKENDLLYPAETGICSSKGITFQPPTDGVCSSDSPGDSLDLQQHYVVSASKNVENNYVERCRDQKAAENVEISDINQTVTPSSPMVVEEGALLSDQLSSFPSPLKLTESLLDRNVDVAHELQKDYDGIDVSNGALFDDSSMNSRSVEEKTGSQCSKLSDLNLGISPLASAETVTSDLLQMNKNITSILQNDNGRDPSAGRDTLTEDVLMSKKNNRSFETLSVACQQIESKLEGTVW